MNELLVWYGLKTLQGESVTYMPELHSTKTLYCLRFLDGEYANTLWYNELESTVRILAEMQVGSS